MDISMNIKQAIKHHGLTLEKVAESMGITKGTLSSTINGNPTIKKLEEIATHLNCSVRDFFEDKERISGFVEFKGKVHTIRSVEDLRRLLILIDEDGKE